MASVKTLTELILLSCLLLMVTSSPIQDKKKTLTPRTGRDFRTKTAGPSLQHPFLSSNKRVHDSSAPTAQFGSSLRTSAGTKTIPDQTIHQGISGIASDAKKDVKKGSEVAFEDPIQRGPDSATHTFRTGGSHSSLPAVSTFGERIPSSQPRIQTSNCNVKGGCATASFTPDGGISVDGVPVNTNTFQEDHQQSISNVHHQQQVTGLNEPKTSGESVRGGLSFENNFDSKITSSVQFDQQQQFNGPNEAKTTGDSQIRQNTHDVFNQNDHYPDYEGLISPHDFTSVKGGQKAINQDQRHRNEGNTQINTAHVSDQTNFDFNHQTQFVTQEHFSGSHQHSQENTVPVKEVTPILPSEHSSSSPSFPSEQTHQNVHSSINEPRNQQRTSHFDQQHTSSSFTTDNQGHLSQQQISGHQTSPNFDSKGHLSQQQISGHQTSPNFDSQGHLSQQQISGHQTSPNFDSKGHLSQQQISGHQTSPNFDSQGHLSQQQISGHQTSPNFDSQGHLSQQPINGQQISPNFDSQGHLSQQPINGHQTSLNFDSEGHLSQQPISGHQTSPNFESQDHLSQQPISGHQISPNFDSQGHLNQQQISGQQASPNFDSQGHLSQQQISGHQTSPDFTPDSQVHLTQQQISGQSHIHQEEGHQNKDDGQYYHSGNPIDWLRYSVPGNPGEDYPIFYQVPETSFDCKQQQFSAGIYGDTEASCQAFHICKDNGGQDSFLCPNGTVFNQQYFVCDWWYNFNCADTPSFYNLNADLYWDWDSFTPTQVLNGPPISDDRLTHNLQTGSQDNLSKIPGSDARGPSVSDFSGQNNAVKSTIAIDNTAIANKDHLIPEQTPEEHTFSDKHSGQDYEQQVQKEFSSSFASDFSDSTRGVQPATVSPFDDDQAVFPVSSDTGANRETGGNTGSRYPGQVGDGYKSTGNFPTFDQRITTVNFENSFANTNAGQEPIAQTFVTQGPEFFDSRNQVTDNTYTGSGNAQNDFGRDKTQLTQFDINPEITSNTGSQDETYFTQTHDHVSDDKNKPTSFDVNQRPDEFPTNGRSDVSSIDQVNQVQQEYVSTSFENTPNAFGTRDQSFVQQQENLNIHNTGPVLDQQKFPKTDVTQSIPDNVFTTDIQDNNRNLDIQQEISSNFDSNRQNNIQDQNLGSFVPQNQIAVDGDTKTSTFDEIGNENIGTTGTGLDHKDQEIQQEHVTSLFDAKNQNVHGTGNFKTNAPFGNDQNNVFPVFQNNFGSRNFNQDENEGQGYAPQRQSGDSRKSADERNNNLGSQTERPLILQTDNLDTTANDNVKNKHFGVNENVQQEYVPAFEGKDINGPNERPSSFGQIDNNQGHTTIPFQPSSHDGFVIRDQFRNQNQRGNHEIGQDQIPVSFDQQPINSFSRDSNKNAPGLNQGNGFSNVNQNNLDRNNFQLTDQQHIPNQFDGRRPDEINNQQPNNFNNGIGESSPYDHTNRNIQQENIIFPFDISSQNAFISENNDRNRNNLDIVPDQHAPSFGANGQINHNRDQSNGPIIPEHQQHTLSEIEQKGISEPFIGDRQNVFETKGNNRHHNEQQFLNAEVLTSGANVPINQPGKPQEHASVAFDGANTFRGSGDDVGRGNVNFEQGVGIDINQQNNFRPISNGNQQNFQGQQIFRQEHVPVNFNNYENRDQNSDFNQNNNNYRPMQYQNQNGNPINGGNAVSHQNANEAFQLRLTNFQPGDIHLMNRGQFQNENFRQQRVSFRPYGQNVPNTVSFPENGPLTHVANQENGANYNNNKGSSNRNFFITNSHQTHDVHPVSQQHNGQGFPNEQPVNNVQDNNQYNAQEFNQIQFNNNPIPYDRNQDGVQNIGDNQQGPSLENNAANSRIKGNFYRRSLDTPGQLTTNVDPRGYSPISINVDDVKNFNQPAAESPNSMGNNGWKPIVKQ